MRKWGQPAADGVCGHGQNGAKVVEKARSEDNEEKLAADETYYHIRRSIQPFTAKKEV
jgi:hypothetical protein